MDYTPDNWVVIKIGGKDPHYRILAGWSGGYLGEDRWRLNSGVVRVEETSNHYKFYGMTASCYICHKSSYGLRRNTTSTQSKLQDLRKDKINLYKENTDWLVINWKIDDRI